MKKTIRAYLITPLSVPALLGLIAIPDLANGRAEGYFSIMILALAISYVISWTFGTVGFLTLRYLRKEHLISYALMGCIMGFLLVIFFDTHLTLGNLLGAAYGTIVAVCFGYIRGSERRSHTACH